MHTHPGVFLRHAFPSPPWHLPLAVVVLPRVNRGSTRRRLAHEQPVNLTRGCSARAMHAGGRVQVGTTIPALTATSPNMSGGTTNSLGCSERCTPTHQQTGQVNARCRRHSGKAGAARLPPLCWPARGPAPAAPTARGDATLLAPSAPAVSARPPRRARTPPRSSGVGPARIGQMRLPAPGHVLVWASAGVLLP